MSALRVSSSAYVEAEAGVGEVVSMNFAALSLPSGNVAGVDLACSLSGSIPDVVLNYEEHMLQDAGTWMDLEEIAGKIKTYDDPQGLRAILVSYVVCMSVVFWASLLLVVVGSVLLL